MKPQEPLTDEAAMKFIIVHASVNGKSIPFEILVPPALWFPAISSISCTLEAAYHSCIIITSHSLLGDKRQFWRWSENSTRRYRTIASTDNGTPQCGHASRQVGSSGGNERNCRRLDSGVGTVDGSGGGSRGGAVWLKTAFHSHRNILIPS